MASLTVTLNEDEVRGIIAEHLRQKYNVENKDITFEASMHIEGVGLAEHKVMKFDCCRARVTEK